MTRTAFLCPDGFIFSGHVTIETVLSFNLFLVLSTDLLMHQMRRFYGALFLSQNA